MVEVLYVGECVGIMLIWIGDRVCSRQEQRRRPVPAEVRARRSPAILPGRASNRPASASIALTRVRRLVTRMSAWVWVVLAVLIVANALYVAAEFGAVGVRRSRVRRMSDDGHWLAQRLLPFLEGAGRRSIATSASRRSASRSRA